MELTGPEKWELWLSELTDEIQRLPRWGDRKIIAWRTILVLPGEVAFLVQLDDGTAVLQDLPDTVSGSNADALVKLTRDYRDRGLVFSWSRKKPPKPGRPFRDFVE